MGTVVHIHQHGVSADEKLVDRKEAAEERLHFPAHFPLDGAKILRIQKVATGAEIINTKLMLPMKGTTEERAECGIGTQNLYEPAVPEVINNEEP